MRVTCLVSSLFLTGGHLWLVRPSQTWEVFSMNSVGLLVLSTPDRGSWGSLTVFLTLWTKRVSVLTLSQLIPLVPFWTTRPRVWCLLVSQTSVTELTTMTEPVEPSPRLVLQTSKFPSEDLRDCQEQLKCPNSMSLMSLVWMRLRLWTRSKLCPRDRITQRFDMMSLWKDRLSLNRHLLMSSTLKSNRDLRTGC